MAFAHIFSVVLSLDLALRDMAKVMLRKLALSAAHVVYLGATKIVVRHSVFHNSVLLSEHLGVMCLLESLSIGFLAEKAIVLISRGSIVE